MGCGSTSQKLDPWLCPDCKLQLQKYSSAVLRPNEDAVSLFPMNELTRRLVHGLKYKGMPGMASYIVRQSALRKCRGSDIWDAAPSPVWVVPVPLHSARFRERGYNQTEGIASAVASVFGGKVVKALRRETFKVSQTKLGRDQREWNVTGAFRCAVPKASARPGMIIVVDDVFTTGATTGACLAALAPLKCPIMKVCTLLYEEPANAAMDYAADIRKFAEYG